MIGFLLDDLSQSQVLCDLVRGARPGVTIYVRRVAPPWFDPPFPVSNWCDAWGAKFPLVATNLDAAFHLLRFPAVPRKFFFVSDLEWTRHGKWGGPPPDHALAALYRHPGLELVCRSESHRRALAEAFNVRPEICKTSLVKYLIEKANAKQEG